MLNKIIALIKKGRYPYTLDGEVIIVTLGTINLFLQLETEIGSEEYTHLQVWGADDDNCNEIDYHEYYDNPTDDELEILFDEAVLTIREVNQNFGKLSLLFKGIEEFVNLNRVPLDLVDRLWSDLEFDYE
jgi:hypothetical protein